MAVEPAKDRGVSGGAEHQIKRLGWNDSSLTKISLSIASQRHALRSRSCKSEQTLFNLEGMLSYGLRIDAGCTDF
jgi:hypothetical protein